MDVPNPDSRILNRILCLDEGNTFNNFTLAPLGFACGIQTNPHKTPEASNAKRIKRFPDTRPWVTAIATACFQL